MPRGDHRNALVAQAVNNLGWQAVGWALLPVHEREKDGQEWPSYDPDQFVLAPLIGLARTIPTPLKSKVDSTNVCNRLICPKTTDHYFSVSVVQSNYAKVLRLRHRESKASGKMRLPSWHPRVPGIDGIDMPRKRVRHGRPRIFGSWFKTIQIATSES